MFYTTFVLLIGVFIGQEYNNIPSVKDYFLLYIHPFINNLNIEQPPIEEPERIGGGIPFLFDFLVQIHDRIFR